MASLLYSLIIRIVTPLLHSLSPRSISILQLCSSIFKAPASLCALFDEPRVFISEQDGGVIPRGEFPW
jgi:hypothetical protein